jgi:hypothetical protein
MAFNETRNLPRWLEHYSSQLGDGQCIVVDHGTDDGSTTRLREAIGRVRLPRHLPYDDHRRAAFISQLVSALLEYYDGVLYTDCDEFLVADPRRYESLSDLFTHCATPHITALGFDVVHLAQQEPLASDRPLLVQRQYVHFNQAMCKTLVVKEPIRWYGGFHTSDHPPHFPGLYLFHAKHADLQARIDRTAVTRQIAMRSGSERQAPHWRFDDAEIQRRAANLQRLPVLDWTDDVEVRVIRDLLSRVIRDEVGVPRSARYAYSGRPPRWLDHALITLPPQLTATV